MHVAGTRAGLIPAGSDPRGPARTATLVGMDSTAGATQDPAASQVTPPDESVPLDEAARLVDSRHWRVLLYRLEAAFRTPDLTVAAALAARVAATAAVTGTVPDVVLRPHRVHVRTTAPGRFGVTRADLELAAAVTQVADELGLVGDPGSLTTQEVAIDALDIPAVLPFWRAVLGYEPPAGLPAGLHVLADPHGTAPGYWFQQMEVARPQRNRVHVDVTVPHDEADARVAAALAAGGRIVSDDGAPGFRVLADPEGNEACVCAGPAPAGSVPAAGR